MSFLLCAHCSVPLYDDPHFDGDEVVCDGCCRAPSCNPFSDVCSGVNDSDEPAVDCSPAAGSTSTAGELEAVSATASLPAVAKPANEEATAPQQRPVA